MSSSSDLDSVRVVILNEFDDSNNQNTSIEPTSISEDPISSISTLVYLLESLAEAVWQEEEAQKQLQLSQLQLESDQLNHLLNLLNQDETTLDLLGRRILSLQGRDSHPFQHHSSRRISEDFHSIHGWSNPLASGSNVLVEDQNQDQQARSVVEALKEELLQDDDQDQDELDEIIFHHLPSISFITSDSEELKSRDRALESSIDLELDWLAEELLRARGEDGDGIWIIGTDALFGDGDPDGFATISLGNPGVEALKYDVQEPSPTASPKRSSEGVEGGEGEERPRKSVKVHDMRSKKE